MTRADPIVAEALAWCGTPFRHGASLRGAGADCLGLVRGVWRAVHGAEPWVLPPYAALPQNPDEEQLENILPQFLPLRRGAPQAGDVLLWRLHPQRPARHLGIALGGGRFIHAVAPEGVVVGHLTKPWMRRLCGVFVLAPITE